LILLLLLSLLFFGFPSAANPARFAGGARRQGVLFLVALTNLRLLKTFAQAKKSNSPNSKALGESS